MARFKGLIIIAEPVVFKAGRDPYYALVDLLCEEYGFGRMELTEDSKIPSDIDLLINYSNTGDQIVELDKRIKLITWVGDVNIPPGTPEQIGSRLKKRIEIYERSDLILSSMGSYFRRKYPQFVYKMIFFPKHYGYYDHFCDVVFNKDPEMKCLLSGSTPEATYPIRAYVKRHANLDLVDRYVSTVPDCMAKEIPMWAYVGEDYVNLLNSYFCCVTDSSIFKCMVGKYFEIPAAGSLLLADRTKDSDEAGFVSGTHYVAVTRSTVLYQIRDCLCYPEKYDRIRREGMMFVRVSHGPSARFEKFKRVIREVIG